MASLLTRRKFLRALPVVAGLPMLARAQSFYLGAGNQSILGSSLSDLIHYWPMNDASGTNRQDHIGSTTLTDPNANVLRSAAGKFTGAALFTGNGTAQQSLISSAVFAVPNPFTISLWWFDSAPGNLTPFVIGNSNGAVTKCQMGLTSGACGGACNNWNIYTAACAGTTNNIGWTLNTFHFLVAGYDGAKAFSYFDGGSIVNSAAVAMAGAGFAFNLYCANLNVSAAAQANGKLCEVGMWARAISGAEAALLWNSGAGLPLGQ